MELKEGERIDRLSRELRIIQRIKGHRATSDDVLLAWAGAQARPEARRILDLGTGKGTVALLLAHHLPSAQIIGVEAFPQSHDQALRNAALNGLSHRFEPRLGDLRDPTVLRGEAPFDLICGAPPFMPLGAGTPPQDPQRAAGRFELHGGIEGYAATAAAWLAESGRAALLMDGLSLDRSVAALKAAGLRVEARWDIPPREGAPPTYRIFICARAGEPDGVTERVKLRPMREGAGWAPWYQAARAALALD
ncbi:methyltransferase domain-containing protein [Myxococcota bacterium]|nr:methyltransferase domain-containing protein [Myxococcota bacterium]MBU1431280.1 methyltransferase domain-containing protein [Myxococcota bacterium]MBU1900456.1 methyltransferase domain-containing protein [Myxococcota bacterium]